MLINIADEKAPDRLCEIICYPSGNYEICRRRLNELYRMGVRHIVSIGRARIGRLNVLGKGCESIVVAGITEIDGIIAIKIRRLDSRRSTLSDEANRLIIANSIGVGPKLLSFSRDFILMEYIDGVKLVEFLDIGDKSKLVRVLLDILKQCYKLDRIGLVHKELSRADRHILIRKSDLKPFILDFETASLTSRGSNLTQVISFLFIKPCTISTKISQILGTVDKTALIKLLKDYKKYRTRKIFEEILKLLHLS